MSVIIGYQNQDKIFIVGDKRACNIKGDVISEDSKKVFVINKHLCFASAGVAVIEKIIMDGIAEKIRMICI